MKNFILFLTLFSFSALSANTVDIYMGFGLSRVNETLQPYLGSKKTTIPNSELSLKIGYGKRSSYAAEFSIDYLQNHSKYYAQSDAQKLGFNVSLLKAYDFGIYINPYLKVGFGAGMLKTAADTNNQSLTYGNFHAGAGFFIPLSRQMDIEVAYKYRYISYEKIDLSNTSNPTSHLNAVYTGFNIRF